MLALIGHNALFSYLTRLHKYGYVCPLHSFCEKEKYDKDECYDEPWNGKMCPMTIMGDVIHIKEKEVKMAQPTNPVECVQSLTQKHVAKRYMIGEKFLPLRHES